MGYLNCYSVLLGAMGESDWYLSLSRSSLTPPGWVFGVVWPILYFMIFLTFVVLVFKGRRSKLFWKAMVVYLVGIGLNLAWTPAFFGWHKINLSFLIICLLWVSIVVNIVLFWKMSKWLVVLFLPYLVWISFACYLNWVIVVLN